ASDRGSVPQRHHPELARRSCPLPGLLPWRPRHKGSRFLLTARSNDVPLCVLVLPPIASLLCQTKGDIVVPHLFRGPWPLPPRGCDRRREGSALSCTLIDGASFHAQGHHRARGRHP